MKKFEYNILATKKNGKESIVVAKACDVKWANYIVDNLSKGSLNTLYLYSYIIGSE